MSMIAPTMTVLPDGRVQVDGGMVANVEDFAGLLDIAWSHVVAARAQATCGEPRCQLGHHPDHPRGHILRGVGVQDRKARAESRL